MANGATGGAVDRSPHARSSASRLFAMEALSLFVYVLVGGTEAALRAAAVQANRPLGADSYVLAGLAHGIALFTITAVTHNVAGAHVNPASRLAWPARDAFRGAVRRRWWRVR